MPGIPDRSFNAACGRLATHLGVSLASARRRVEILAAQEGLRDTAAKVALAEKLLDETRASGLDRGQLFDGQLRSVGEDDLFMIED
ncbi:hypothetical protein [Synechococcus sp. CCY 9618]|uniref:hypothetical protein n=1 Tax=Synechococcus sp. CCY 9618 TaxID=2815602 RepID=UPI001C21A941|nr:hypothetical protein [Synechococcus sp. CCY 9618]